MHTNVRTLFLVLAIILLSLAFAISMPVKEASSVHGGLQTSLSNVSIKAVESSDISFIDTTTDAAVTSDALNISAADGKNFRGTLYVCVNDHLDTDGNTVRVTLTVVLNDGDGYASTSSTVSPTDDSELCSVINVAGKDPGSASNQPTVRLSVDESTGDTEAQVDAVLVISVTE